ncbi:MAG: hypothetical protein KY468_07585 [Armatimonadetes bacterium]|nr:hypothetical protein [Armatimonadota bacterium]
MNPKDILQAGCDILDPLLLPYGFDRLPIQEGKSSGGHFAFTEYRRGHRRLELHYRYSLGMVTYHIGGLSLEHRDYMRVVLGQRGGNQYPGFSNDPLDGFRHLRHDLEHYGQAFLEGLDEEFRRVVKTAARLPTGFKALSAE